MIMVLLNIQYLRGIAALMVVVFHVLDSGGRLGGDVVLPGFSLGEAGVDLFFVISGFIIWTTTSRSQTTPSLFLAKRLKRVVPLYWLLTLAMAAVALAAPNLLRSTVFDPAHLLASLAFWPYPHPTFGAFNPVLFVGWTLNYEMAFYLTFALVLPLKGAARAGGFLAASLFVVQIGQMFRPAGIAGFYTDPIVLEFTLGVLIGLACDAGLRTSRTLAALAVAAGAVALLAAENMPVHRLARAGLPMALIVFGAVFWERARPAPALALPLAIGNASYSLYLTHLIALPIGQIAWLKLFGVPSGGVAIATYVVFCTLACLLAGILAYRFLERPLNALTRGMKDRGARGQPIADLPQA